MIFFGKIEKSKAANRITLPVKLCREMGFGPGDDFIIEALDPETIVLRFVDLTFREKYREKLGKLKIINYDK